MHEVYKLINQLDLDIGHKEYHLINIFIHTLSYDALHKQSEQYQMYLHEITDVLSKLINEHEGNFVFMNRIGEWIVIYNGHMEDEIKETANMLLDSLYNQSQLSAFIAISHCFSDLRHISKAYFCTRDIIKYRFYFGNKAIVFSNELNQTTKLKDIKKMDYEELFLEYIKNGMEEQAVVSMNTFF